VGQTLHKRLISSPKEGIALLKFIYGDLYNDKMLQRYGHAPTDECPLYQNPNARTHIAGECPDHEALRISRHNAACHLAHAAIRKTEKRGGALHSAPDLVRVAADTGSQSQTSDETLESLSSTSEGDNINPRGVASPSNWLAHLPMTEDTRRKRHTDVSQDPRYKQRGLSAPDGDA